MTYRDILEGPEVPAPSGKTDSILLLLHGVGADGKDLVGLAPLFQGVLPNTLCVSPNAPNAFDMGPAGFGGGYQWFSLKDTSPDAMIAGVKKASATLDKYITALLEEYNLPASKLGILGFSQGIMTGLYTALRLPEPVACVAGYSGLVIGDENMPNEVTAKPPVMLVHGAEDDIVPANLLDISKAALEEVGVKADTHLRPGLAHGIDEEGIKMGIAFVQQHLAA